MIEFASPWAFLILPLPALVYYFVPRAVENNSALRVPFFNRAVRANTTGASAKLSSGSYLKVLTFSFIWLSLVLAAAQPLRSGEPVVIPSKGRDLMLAMDLSGSMATADMIIQGEKISRFIVVKHILKQFLEKRQGDRVGLIVFGSRAYLHAPLTFDLKTVGQFLEETSLRLAGQQTAIGEAIGLAIKRLKDRPESQRVLILITDGKNSAGRIQPEKAAELAAQAGVKIYTIGVGAEEIQVSSGLFGTQTVNPASDLDERSLIFIAEQTGGQYFRARDPQELLGIYETLDELEAIELEDAVFRPKQSLYFYPLGLAFIVLLAFYCAQYLMPKRGWS